MNECVIVGQLKSMPEISSVGNGVPVANLIVESDRNFRNEDGTFGTDVFRVSVWRGQAEQAANLLKPGDMIAIRGRLSGRAVKKEDRTNYFTEVIAESVEYLHELNRRA